MERLQRSTLFGMDQAGEAGIYELPLEVDQCIVELFDGGHRLVFLQSENRFRQFGRLKGRFCLKDF